MLCEGWLVVGVDARSDRGQRDFAPIPIPIALDSRRSWGGRRRRRGSGDHRSRMAAGGLTRAIEPPAPPSPTQNAPRGASMEDRVVPALCRDRRCACVRKVMCAKSACVHHRPQCRCAHTCARSRCLLSLPRVRRTGDWMPYRPCCVLLLPRHGFACQGAQSRRVEAEWR